MKVVKKNVFYCEHCKKHGLRSDSMQRHETSCTINPNRTCGFPWCGGEPDPALIAETMAYGNDIAERPEWQRDELRYGTLPKEYCEYLLNTTECPACTLAILRIARAELLPIVATDWDWNYKTVAKEMLNEYYSEMAAEAGGYGYY